MSRKGRSAAPGFQPRTENCRGRFAALSRRKAAPTGSSPPHKTMRKLWEARLPAEQRHLADSLILQARALLCVGAALCRERAATRPQDFSFARKLPGPLCGLSRRKAAPTGSSPPHKTMRKLWEARLPADQRHLADSLILQARALLCVGAALCRERAATRPQDFSFARRIAGAALRPFRDARPLLQDHHSPIKLCGSYGRHDCQRSNGTWQTH